VQVQVTVVSMAPDPWTVAVKVTLWPPSRVSDVGLIETLLTTFGWVTVTVALADLETSHVFVAVTV
jgi:hypothetical protein